VPSLYAKSWRFGEYEQDHHGVDMIFEYPEYDDVQDV
jgi:hypothetical protein